jgi:hypothetical protein
MGLALYISKLLNLATAFLIFTTVTKHIEATDPQCRSGTAPQNSTVHMTADVSHIQLVENFHKFFVLLLTSTYVQLLQRNHALILVSLFFLFFLFILVTL